MQRTTRAESLLCVADIFDAQGAETALATAKQLLPWESSKTTRTTFTKEKAILVFPGALLAFGVLFPSAFPMSPTWKVSDSHEIFWELWPVVDHIVPVTRHGSNAPENLATTSAVNNSAKGSALLTELQWTLLPPPQQSETWDGMLSWFMRLVTERPSLLELYQLKGWHKAAVKNAA